jgi:hypothetical protein
MIFAIPNPNHCPAVHGQGVSSLLAAMLAQNLSEKKMKISPSIFVIAAVLFGAAGCDSEGQKKVKAAQQQYEQNVQKSIAAQSKAKLQERLEKIQQDKDYLNNEYANVDLSKTDLTEKQKKQVQKGVKSWIKQVPKLMQQRIKELDKELQDAIKKDAWLKAFIEHTSQLLQILEKQPEAAIRTNYANNASWYKFWSEDYPEELSKQIKGYIDQIVNTNVTEDARNVRRASLIRDYEDGNLVRVGYYFTARTERRGGYKRQLTAITKSLEPIVQRALKDPSAVRSWRRNDYGGRPFFSDEEIISKLQKTIESNNAATKFITDTLLPALKEKYD